MAVTDPLRNYLLHYRDRREAADRDPQPDPYVRVLKAELLDIARIAGDDLSDIDHPDQIVYPTLLEFVTRAVRDLRESYDECLQDPE